ncbi:MAG: 3-oxoacyl-ACP synthase, partial [Betaproteobacteria bacterium]|nr:3-oxoacyl-ACP synthase [Betaproteobacteria bacterium]
MIYSRIVGTGSYLPGNIVTNADLATRVETSDEWIRTRTGICQRHLAAEGQTSSVLAHEAA